MTIKSRTRKTDAKVVKTNKGVAISCPYCEVPHPIGLNRSACGTRLEIKAVQDVYTGATCALCGKPGGRFVKVGNLYAHTPNCTPGKVLFEKPPKLSFSAMLAHKMPNIVAKSLDKIGLRTFEVANPETNKIIGYSWFRKPKGVKV